MHYIMFWSSHFFRKKSSKYWYLFPPFFFGCILCGKYSYWLNILTFTLISCKHFKVYIYVLVVRKLNLNQDLLELTSLHELSLILEKHRFFCSVTQLNISVFKDENLHNFQKLSFKVNGSSISWIIKKR